MVQTQVPPNLNYNTAVLISIRPYWDDRYAWVRPVQDVFAMTNSPTRILTQWNRNNQPVGDSSSLLAGFLNQVTSNFGNFPMLYENWKEVPEQYKNNIYLNTIQEIANKNAANRAKLVIPHILGSKTLARKINELELMNGREFSRAEMYQVFHKKPDGTFVNEEARELHAQVAEVDVLKSHIAFFMQWAKRDKSFHTPDLESLVNRRSSEGNHMPEGLFELSSLSLILFMSVMIARVLGEKLRSGQSKGLRR
ncbi:hypothetical protein Fmac_015499 [Flemingia macrophylla]|uniref:Uncharacterized protein n=1 Tax=Flemingia macrophylla TaxID=520843 RepID=A0ABD1MER5_9FABA